MEQQKTLLALIHQFSTSPTPTFHHLNTYSNSISSNINFIHSSSLIDSSWIFDTRATNHVCHSKNMFTHLVKIKHIHVRLQKMEMFLKLIVLTLYFFSDSFYLTDVLYIPNFCTNLISVPKITKNLKWNIIFNSYQCFIQGTHTLKKIGATELHDGLYVLTFPTF